MSKISTKKTRSDYFKKELKFKHKGRDYIVVVQCRGERLNTAAHKSQNGNGTVLNSAVLYDMTSFREHNK